MQLKPCWDISNRNIKSTSFPNWRVWGYFPLPPRQALSISWNNTQRSGQHQLSFEKQNCRSYSLSVGLIGNSAGGLVFFFSFHLQIAHKRILIFPKWIYSFQKYTPAGAEAHKHNGSTVPNSLWLLWITQPSPAHWTKPAAPLELLACFPLGFSFAHHCSSALHRLILHLVWVTKGF